MSETIWWRTNKNDFRSIVPIRVTKETERFLTIIENAMWTDGTSERRSAKRGEYEMYWPTWEAARGYLVSAAIVALRHLDLEVLDMKEALAFLEAAREPESKP